MWWLSGRPCCIFLLWTSDLWTFSHAWPPGRQTPSTMWTKPVYYGLFIIKNSTLHWGYFCAGRVCRCGNTNARMLFLYAGEKRSSGSHSSTHTGEEFLCVLGQLWVTNDFHHRCSEPASTLGSPPPVHASVFLFYEGGCSSHALRDPEGRVCECEQSFYVSVFIQWMLSGPWTAWI